METLKVGDTIKLMPSGNRYEIMVIHGDNFYDLKEIDHPLKTYYGYYYPIYSKIKIVNYEIVC